MTNRLFDIAFGHHEDVMDYSAAMSASDCDAEYYEHLEYYREALWSYTFMAKAYADSMVLKLPKPECSYTKVGDYWVKTHPVDSEGFHTVEII